MFKSKKAKEKEMRAYWDAKLIERTGDVTPYEGEGCRNSIITGGYDNVFTSTGTAIIGGFIK